MKCAKCKTCPLEFELSQILELCRWCRQELRPDWDDVDWLEEWLLSEEVDYES